MYLYVAFYVYETKSFQPIIVMDFGMNNVINNFYSSSPHQDIVSFSTTRGVSSLQQKLYKGRSRYS